MLLGLIYISDAGVVWMLALQVTVLVLLSSPAWKELSLRLIGH